MLFLNNNMSSTYNIRKITLLYRVYPYFFIESNLLIKPSKLNISTQILHYIICILLFMLFFLLKIHLDPSSFILRGESTKFKTWLVQEVYSFNLFLGINIIYYFQVIGMLINYKQHAIHSFHERSLCY